MFFVRKIELPVPGLVEMQAEAEGEGYTFLDTLLSEWENGANRFDGPGELLCGHFDNGVLVAIGGLNRDPFLNDPTVGRIRRVYVRRAWRDQGIGSALLDTLLERARENFATVRLRAASARAASFYERKGLKEAQSPTATHVLNFQKA